MSRKFSGGWIIFNILGAAALFIVLIVGANMLLKVITKHNQEIRVPDLTGMSVDEAGQYLSARGMRMEITDSVYIKRMERGVVYRQNPEPGDHVKKGRRILLTINAVNPKQVTMPNLIGYSLRQAKAEILSRGLSLGTLIYVEDIATNNVLKQLHGNSEIKPGTPIESESRIDLVVGLNSLDNKTYVPYVTGMKYLAAVNAVQDNSLNIEDLIFDYTVRDYADSIDAVVYRQVPEESEEGLLMGSPVTLYLTTDTTKVPERPEPSDSTLVDMIPLENAD